MKIVWTKKRNPRIFLEKIASLQDLAIGELVEFQAPLSFMLVLICAFYGPNSGLIGNIGNAYWHYEKLEDITETLKNMAFLFLVDFSSTIVSAIILWLSCGINLFRAFLELHREFGKIFSLILGNCLLVVCVNCFEWLFCIGRKRDFPMMKQKLTLTFSFIVLEPKLYFLGKRFNFEIRLDWW